MTKYHKVSNHQQPVTPFSESCPPELQHHFGALGVLLSLANHMIQLCDFSLQLLHRLKHLTQAMEATLVFFIWFLRYSITRTSSKTITNSSTLLLELRNRNSWNSDHLREFLSFEGTQHLLQQYFSATVHYVVLCFP